MQLLTADTPERLEAALATLADLGVVGVDVERADSDRYFRTPALIQVGGDARVALVDPLALDDLAPLQRFVAQRLTVLHALDNDLVPLASVGVTPPALADTAVAAMLLGLPTGLERLLTGQLGTEPPGDKEAMQRADWEQRPLTEQMRTYAAADVADLPALWRELATHLAALGRTPWYQEELAALLAQPPLEQRRAWTRLRGVGRLDADGRRRARALWHRRESLARTTDTAPGRIAPDRLLVDLASTPPSSARELGRRGMRREAVRRFGSALVKAAESPQDVPAPPGADDVDAPTGRGRRPTSEEKALDERLRGLRAEIAEELGIDAGVLCPGRAVTTAVQATPSDPEQLRAALGLRQWQWALLAQPFCEALGLAPQEQDGGDTHAEEGSAATMADTLSTEQVQSHLAELPGWSGGPEGITKSFDCGDFIGAMGFCHQVALEAEKLFHHPDIEINYKRVTLRIVSHAKGGVTEQCVELAKKVERRSP
jgi:ribonuclease D